MLLQLSALTYRNTNSHFYPVFPLQWPLFAQFLKPSSTGDMFTYTQSVRLPSASFCTSAVTWKWKQYVPSKRRNKAYNAV
jgi:hypothetical protein